MNQLRHGARRGGRFGYTLPEMMVASAISVVVIGMAVSAFVHALWVWNQEGVINELNLNLEIAMDWFRRDIRLSSVGTGHMSFYPASGAEYEAISMPLAEDTDGDGLLERDADNKIKWTKTVIYHVRPGDPYELRRTVFSPRYTNATPEQLYNQLQTVVVSSNTSQLGAATLTGESMSTQVIFKNLVEMRVHPSVLEYDAYSATRQRDGIVNMGSVVLTPGDHQLKLTVIGKNANSAGYKVGIDNLSLSATQSRRDGELYTPVGAHPASPLFYYTNTGGSVTAQDMSTNGAEWSGKAQLTFNATAVSNKIVFTVYNDMWVDNNFDDPTPSLTTNTSVKFDATYTNQSPNIGDYVVTLDKGLAWGSDRPNQGGDTLVISNSALSITNIIYGGTNDAAAINLNGEWVRLRFDAGDWAPLFITNVTLINEATGASSNVTFGGKASVSIPTWSNTWSDWVPNFVIDETKNYRVAMTVGGLGDRDVEMFSGGVEGRLWYSSNIGTPQAPAWGGATLMAIGGTNIDVGDFSVPAFADLDADGDQDVVMGRQAATLTYFANNSTATNVSFAAASNNWSGISLAGYGVSAGADPYTAPAFADIDNDGDLDLFVGAGDGRIHYYQNTGNVMTPVWASANHFWQGIDIGIYSAPAFADIDGDGDLDLFIGEYPTGYVFQYQNTGSVSNFAWTAPALTNTFIINSPLSQPRFTDIDADGDNDLFVGGYNGWIDFYRNTGTSTNALWAETNQVYTGLNVGSYSAPAFANMNRDRNGIWMETNTTLTMSYTNGVACNALLGLYQLEVGYPSNGIYRSGVFDTRIAAPVYTTLNWSQYEDMTGGGNVDVRIRSADTEDGIKTASWTDANASDAGYFQGNSGNSLATLPHKRYVQYEAQLRCFLPGAHTNSATAKLRDATIAWPAVQGILDLQVGFSKGPDYGIVSAQVDSNSFVKGATVELTIYKYSRPFGTNVVTGMLEVKPLNTGR